MFLSRSNCSIVLLSSLFCLTPALAQEPAPQDAPTAGEHRLQVTSSLVFLDVTVVDKHGKPVTKGLSKDDFVITEDKEKQRIFSFESEEEHVVASDEAEQNKAPVTIFVFDELNTDIDQFAYLRQEARNYIAALPAELAAPAEMMVIGNKTLELMQGYTRSREDLLFAIDHLPVAVPFKLNNSGFASERVQQSIAALQQIVLQNEGVKGKKNIIWVGQGAPGLSITPESERAAAKLKQHIHDTANLLVNARISLSLVFPAPTLIRKVTDSSDSGFSEADPGTPFSGGVNFADFVQETGGQLFYNSNGIGGEITRAEELGSQYYTLTYVPNEAKMDGRFRRIHIAMRDPNLHAITKTGYFSPTKDHVTSPREQATNSIIEAARASIPLTSLPLVLFRVVQLQESHAAVVTLQIPTKSLNWETGDDGKSKASMILAAVSKSGNADILASKVEAVNITADSSAASQLDKGIARVSIQVQVPRRTHDVRVVVQLEGKQAIGSVDVSKQVLDSAPAASPVKAQVNASKPDAKRATP